MLCCRCSPQKHAWAGGDEADPGSGPPGGRQVRALHVPGRHGGAAGDRGPAHADPRGLHHRPGGEAAHLAEVSVALPT